MPTKDNHLSNLEKHERQLIVLKQQVKAIMEEAVTKKFIHEESPHVLRFCGTVEKCLLDGLKKRASVFRRSNKLANLFNKVGKSLPSVAKLIPLIEVEEMKIDKQPSSPDSNLISPNSYRSINSNSSGKYLWVRMAVTAKVLDKIAEFLVQNHKKFYDDSSIISDPVRGKIFSALLMGPCALDYTKVKTSDHYWSDPPADELLQRHKLHSRGYPNSPVKRPALQFSSQRRPSFTDCMDRGSGFRDYVESLHQNSKVPLLYGKNNVTVQPDEMGPIAGYLSLHQEGSRLMIKWIPNQLMNGSEPQIKRSIPEHGTVEQNGDVINGDLKEDSDDTKNSRRKFRRQMSLLKSRNRSYYWEFSISVDVREIVYLHCHQSSDSVGVLVLVGQDGVQWPPIRFPPGGHLLTFISCLETALLPQGCLDPPLWSEKGKERVFPRLLRKGNRSSPEDDDNTTNSRDVVFRISTRLDRKGVAAGNNGALISHRPDFHLLNSISTLPGLLKKKGFNVGFRSKNNVVRSVSVPHLNGLSPNGSASHFLVDKTRRGSQTFSLSADDRSRLTAAENGNSPEQFVPNLDMYTYNQNQPRRYNQSPAFNGLSNIYSGSSLKMLCESMRRQIISRAFYGWLAHCRHIASVRTYLAALVNNKAADSDWPTDATVGVTEEVWNTLFQNGKLTDYSELCRYIYFGGVRCKELRPIIWLYLLGFYDPDSDEDGRSRAVEESREYYRKIRTVDEDIKLKYSGKPSARNEASMTPFNENPPANLIPAQRFLLQQQASMSSDVFASDLDRSSDINPPSIDENHFAFPVVDETKETTEVKKSPKNCDQNPIKRCHSCEEVVQRPSPSGTLVTSRWRTSSVDECVKKLSSTNQNSENITSCEDNECSTISSHDDAEGSQDIDFEMNKTRSSTVRSDSSDVISVNLTQIEKDVFRCDRNHAYFSKQENLDKLSNIMSCYVWEHPDPGYVQGMCDLAAPLLVLLDDESLVYSCFVKFMDRITFQKGNAMDVRLANLRSLTQVLDYELYEYLQRTTDSTHFFFCYRWFLLEFKRELSYNEDVFAMWECTWAARSCSTHDFGLFFALAILQNYREIILENELDFSGIVKFFNEMAEKHDVKLLMAMARKLVADVQQNESDGIPH